MPPNEPAPSTANTALLAANHKPAASARRSSAKMPMTADTLGEFSPPCIDRVSNRTFSEFFLDEVGLDIDAPAYSLNGPSKAKRLRTFLRTGPKNSVVNALRALWEYRERTRLRSGAPEKLPNASRELSTIIRSLGGKPLSQPCAPVSQIFVEPTSNRVLQLAQDFLGLVALEPQPRGYAFERFLKDLFDAYGLEARHAFRLTGEQIDGSFQLANETYLLEAKWQDAQADAASLRAFQGKIEDKSAWARGLFVSYAGYTEVGLTAFGGKRIILIVKAKT